MSKTFFATNDDLTIKAWHEQLFREIMMESFFSKFMDSKGTSIVHVANELAKGEGDEVTFGIRLKLQGDGQESEDGNITLEGREEALRTRAFKVRLKEVGHAVRDKGPMARQRVKFSIDEESRAALLDWSAEKIDQDIFNALYAKAFTKNFYGGAATKNSELIAGSKITPMLLSKAKAWAETGGHRSQPPIKPVKVSGKPYYVVLLHPDCLFDLKQDSTFQQWMREAEARGSSNPLFTGAVAMVDGLVIHSHERVVIGTNGGSGAIPYAKNVLLGAQALAYAWGKDKPKIVAKKFEYDREHGYAINWISGCGRVEFKFDGSTDKDYGVVGIETARTNLA